LADWEDPEGALDPQVWWAGYNQSDDRDAKGLRMLVYAEDGGLGWTWDSVLAHPQIEGLYFVASVADLGCTACTTGGVYTLEKRYNAKTGTIGWDMDRLSGYDLENPQVTDLTWGSAGAYDPTMTDIYVSTAGSGVWGGLITW
jgi:hypothetical protein